MDCIGIYGANNQLVAEIRDPESVKPQEREAEEALFRANARLIAAAPELLEALQAIREQINDDGSITNKFDEDEIEALDTLIAKAEGKES
jgi:hypothetical protein